MAKPKRRRDSFHGCVSFELGTTNITVVSFPGAYTQEWNMLVDLSRKLAARRQQGQEPGACAAGSTCCVFLPPGSGLFGLHSANTLDEDKKEECWCVSLYGSQEEFGCRWFQVWKEHLEKAQEKGHKLIVVFKEDQRGDGADAAWPPKIACNETNRGLPGLGVSQRGEVAFMRQLGLELHYEDINDFRRRLLRELEAELRVPPAADPEKYQELKSQREELLIAPGTFEKERMWINSCCS